MHVHDDVTWTPYQ